MATRTVICTAPWRTITLAENRYRPCCRIVAGEYSRFPTTQEELMAHVNSPFMRELRRQVHAKEIGGTICESCVRSGMNEPELYDYRHMADPRLLERIDKTRDAIRRGAEVLNEPPLELGFSFPGVCNIHCKMCTVHSYSKLGKRRIGNVFLDDAKALLSSVGFENVATLRIGGGEPLFNPATLEMMEYAAERMHPETVLSTGTNGKELARRIDLLKRFPNLDMNISVDAVGSAYETIRVGIAWETILENLRLVSETARDFPNWHITTRTVLMRTSLPSLPELVGLFLDHGFKPHFAPIFGDFYDENIYWYSGLLADMDWKAHFAEAIAVARSRGSDGVAGELAFRLAELRRQIEKGDYGYYRASPTQFRRFADWCERHFAGKRIALFGMTEEIGYFLHYYHSVKTSFTIGAIALLEDIPAQVTGVLGIDLVPPETLADWQGPILVSCDSRSFGRYMDYARDTYPMDRVAVLSSDTVEADVPGVLERVGDAPVVLFGAGGFSAMLLRSTHLSRANIVAFSDNDKAKWGTRFEDKPVVAPASIPEVARDVIVCSRAYEYDIARSLQNAHGDRLAVHTLFS